MSDEDPDEQDQAPEWDAAQSLEILRSFKELPVLQGEYWSQIRFYIDHIAECFEGYVTEATKTQDMVKWLRRNFSAVGDQWDIRWSRPPKDKGSPTNDSTIRESIRAIVSEYLEEQAKLYPQPAEPFVDKLVTYVYGIIGVKEKYGE